MTTTQFAKGQRVTVRHESGITESGTVDSVTHGADHPQVTVHFQDDTYMSVGAHRVTPADGDYRAEWAHREAQQEWVNRLAEKHGPDVAARAILALATRDHRPYPQYRNFWAGWRVGVVTQTLRSKGGVQGEPGDVVLMHNEPTFPGGWPDRTFYSVRLGWNCSGPYGIREA